MAKNNAIKKRGLSVFKGFYTEIRFSIAAWKSDNKIELKILIWKDLSLKSFVSPKLFTSIFINPLSFSRPYQLRYILKVTHTPNVNLNVFIVKFSTIFPTHILEKKM